ncbi:MAG: ribonuclease III [Ardenticatenales bacterium]
MKGVRATGAPAGGAHASPGAVDPAAPEALPCEGLVEALDLAVVDLTLLRTALTHRSFVNENAAPTGSAKLADNERLEFLGDAVLGDRVGEQLYLALPEADEGELTRLRSALVCQASLARFAASIDLGAYLRIGRGEAVAGSRGRPALLCAAFESVVGAVFLDAGMDVAAQFIDRFVDPEIARMSVALRSKDARSQFQERVQAIWKVTPRYRVAAQIGPDHEKRFVVEVAVGERVWARGEGHSKAEASQRAAAAALEALDALDAADESDP